MFGFFFYKVNNKLIMKKKSLIISSFIAIMAIVLGTLGYMYFNTSCDTYIIGVTLNKTELVQTFHTEDTVEANIQIKNCMDSINDNMNDRRNYYENELLKSIKKLYSNGFTGNIDAVLYGDYYDIDCTDFNIEDQISQIRALYDLMKESYNIRYGVIIFKHNHFWKPKKLNKKELTKQLFDIKNHKDKIEEAKKKYRAEIYYRVF